MQDHPIDDSETAWTKEYTDRQQVDDLLNEVPTQGALVHTHHHAASDYAERVEAARSVIKRDYAALVVEAMEIGRRLGADAYYSWQVNDKGGKQTIEGVSIDAVQELANAFGAFEQQVDIEKVDGAKIWLRISVTDFVTMRSIRLPAVFTLSAAPGKYGADRWMAMQMNAAASKATRSAMERIMPRSLLNLILHEAKLVVERAAQNSTLATTEKITAWTQWAKQRGLTLDQLGAAVGHAPGTPWTQGQLSMLATLSKQMKTEGLTIAEVFGVEPTAPTAPEGGLGGAPKTTTPTPTAAPAPQTTDVAAVPDDLRVSIEEYESSLNAPTEAAELGRWRAANGLTVTYAKANEPQLRGYLAKLKALATK